MKKIDAFYDGSDTGWKPIDFGQVYPAHVHSLVTRELERTKSGPAVVFNTTYVIHDDAAKQTQDEWQMDGYEYEVDNEGNRIPVVNGTGEQETAPCSHIVGRKFRDRGTFCFTTSESANLNRRYVEYMKLFGFEPEVSKGKDDKEYVQLSLLESDDIVGSPVLVKLGQEEYITSDTKHLPEAQQEKRKATKVFKVVPWTDGPKLSPAEMEEDIPF